MTVIRYLLECIGAMTFALCVAALLVACVGEFRYWLAHRHDERDEFGNYLEALREPGVGDLRVVIEADASEFVQKMNEVRAAARALGRDDGGAA